MKKPHWQSVLDLAKDKAIENPHNATMEMLHHPEKFSHLHKQHVYECSAKGWLFKVSKLVVKEKNIHQWHFSGLLDPIGRPFDIKDMNFLVEAANYVGADVRNSSVDIVFGHTDEPIHFCWAEKDKDEADNQS